MVHLQPTKRYVLHLIVSGLSLEDESDMATISQTDLEFYASSRDDVVEVTAILDAENGTNAAYKAATELERLLPHIRVIRFDADLVAASDIASRVGITRQAVGHYVDGSRQAGEPFPQPLGWVSNGTRVWDWASVVEWLRQHVNSLVDDDEYGLSRIELDLVNATLARRSEAPVLLGENLRAFSSDPTFVIQERELLSHSRTSSYDIELDDLATAGKLASVIPLRRAG